MVVGCQFFVVGWSSVVGLWASHQSMGSLRRVALTWCREGLSLNVDRCLLVFSRWSLIGDRCLSIIAHRSLGVNHRGVLLLAFSTRYNWWGCRIEPLFTWILERWILQDVVSVDTLNVRSRCCFFTPLLPLPLLLIAWSPRHLGLLLRVVDGVFLFKSLLKMPIREDARGGKMLFLWEQIALCCVPAPLSFEVNKIWQLCQFLGVLVSSLSNPKNPTACLYSKKKIKKGLNSHKWRLRPAKICSTLISPSHMKNIASSHGNWWFSKLQHLARYDSRHHAMAYDNYSDCKDVDLYNTRKRYSVIESLDLMRNISWLASCFSKIKKPNKHCSENQSVIAGVCILTQYPIFILK